MRNLCTAILLLIATSAHSENHWALQIYTGTAHSFSSSLTVGTLKFDAEYATKPFQDAPYYAWRVSRIDQGGAWEVELIHHKLYLDNPEPPIQHFEVTHGYNLLLINRSWRFPSLIIRAGGGVVIAHPETEVGSVIGPSEYHLTGPAAQGAAEKRFYVSKRVFFSVEGKLTVSRATFQVANGDAKVSNVALHALVGAGLEL